MKTVKFFPIFALLALLTASGSSQDEPIRVETSLVTLNVAVTDSKGNYVGGLSRNDFTVLDNGLKQDVDSFSIQNAPVSLGIVYDTHPASEERTASILAALRTFTGGLRQADDFFVTVFNEKGSLTTDFVPTGEQIRTQVGGGANSLYDAIFAASNKIAVSRNHKRVLLVLTDGADHSSRHTLKDLKQRLRSINLPVYAITFGGADKRQFGYSDVFRGGPRQTLRVGETTELDRGMIAEISKNTGGQTFEGNVRNRVYLTALCSKVYDEVRNQYVIGFYPDKLDGKYHKLKVTIAGQKQGKFKISNRKGYQSARK